MMIKNLERSYRDVATPELPPEEPTCFESNDEVVEAARCMVRARSLSQRNAEASEDSPDPQDLTRRWTRFWHESVEMTGDGVPLTARLREHELEPLDREIVAVLLLDRLGLLARNAQDPGSILQLVSVPPGQTMSALRALSPHGRLAEAGLISHLDPENDLCDQRIVLDPTLVEGALTGQECDEGAWDVESEDELYERLEPLSHSYLRRSTVLNRSSRHHIPLGNREDGYRFACRIDRLRRRLQDTLKRHPDWGLSKLLGINPPLEECQKDILLALLAKELGHVPPGDDIFTGRGLACVVARDESRVRHRLQLLRSDSLLVTEGLARPAGGNGELATDDPHALADAEFELGPRSLRLLQLENQSRTKADGESEVRPPRVRFNQLVLSDSVQRALKMALAQVRHRDVLYESWGLGDVLPYGRGLTLLFSGPPGVGKTACAEALAHEIDRPILVADYSQVQNCWVGQTEKNIVRTFRTARSARAVLFWDEADAMFYDRDRGFRAHEVRQVNVLLQELERFDGVCILATNRKISLDKALERRIGMKVEFERPDRDMRRRIWRRLIPPRMPLGDGVDLSALAEADLTGGEIKNAVVNAARRAVTRGNRAHVTMEDFRAALHMETDGKWSAGGPSGFVQCARTQARALLEDS